MKKYQVLVFALTAVAVYFGYKWFSQRPPEVWKYISDSATVIISSSRLQESYYPAEADSLLPPTYRDLPLVSLAAGTLSIIKWFNQDQDQINTFLKDKTITYAFQPLAGGRLGIVMYLPVENELEAKWLDNPKTGSLRVSSHNFQGHTVTDISNEKSEALFSYILKNNYLIISQYGELIEDVIRNAKSGNAGASEKFHPLPEGRHDLSIYTKGKEWRNFVLPSNLDPAVTAFLDLLPENHGFHLASGNNQDQLVLGSEDSKVENNVYSALISDQEGTVFENPGHISQQTTHLIRLAVSNEGKFRKSYRKWIQARRTLPSLAAFEKATGKEKNAFYDQVGPEIILCINENAGNVSDNKIMLIRFGDFEVAQPALQALAKSASARSVKNTLIQGYEVYPASIPGLTEGLFGPLFKGFNESYFTYISPYLVVGNSVKAVRNYLVDYENQLTWTHSPGLDSLNMYGDNTAQLRLITNISKAKAIAGGRRPGLKSSIDRLTSTSLGYQQKGKYTDLSLSLQYAPPAKQSNRTELKADVVWKESVPYTLSAVSDPVTGNSEMVLTNLRHELIKISSDAGQTQVITQLDGPITGRAFKTDFLNVGRQQWVFCTSRFLYVVDEDENGVVTVLTDPAPIAIQSIYRINESRESSAKFLLKGADESLYLWEKVHSSPMKIGPKNGFDPVLSPVVSLTNGSSTHYVVTQNNGRVFVIDEAAGVLRGYPIDMLSRVNGAFAATQNSVTGETEIRGVNRQGEFVKFDLEGGLKSRVQLLLPEAGCNFRTLHDENSLDWLLLRQTNSKAALLTKEGDEIFEIVNLRRDFVLRYHYFGSDNRFITVVSGGFASVFDLNGNRIGDTPIPCQGGLGLTYQGAKKEVTLFSQTQDKIQIWSVKL